MLARNELVAAQPGRPDAPTMTVMQSAGKGATFGLDRPLRLLGGNGLVPEGAAGRPLMDWAPDLSAIVDEACRRQRAADAYWFRLPPLALCGATVDEARFVARRIARSAGLPLLVMNAQALQPDALLRSGVLGPELVVPPEPVFAMASSGCANPLVLVLGAESAPSGVVEGLAAMLDAQTGRRWLCRSMDAVLDLGGIGWMIATTHEHALPTCLFTRLVPTPIDVPVDETVRMLRVIAMAEEVMADHDLEIEEVADVLATIFDDPDGVWSAMSSCSAGALHEEVARKLLRAVHAPRF